MQRDPYTKEAAEARLASAAQSKKAINQSNTEAFQNAADKAIAFLDTLQKRSGMNTAVWTDPEKLSEAINDYLQYAMTNKLYPTLSGLALWLGISNDKLFAMEACGDMRADLIKNFRTFLSDFMAQVGMNREGNPAYQIFMEKSRLGMNDKPELNLNINLNQQGTSINAARIEDGFIGGIPIDVDFDEVDE